MKYCVSADKVPEKEIIVNSKEEAIAWFAYFTALTNERMGLDGDDAYLDYHHRRQEDMSLSFEDYAGCCDMIWVKTIIEED